MKASRESDLVKACLQLLRLSGCLAWRTNTGALRAAAQGKQRFVRFGSPGMSDPIGLLPGGRFVAVECKRPGNEPTPVQQAFLDLVRERGGPV